MNDVKVNQTSMYNSNKPFKCPVCLMGFNYKESCDIHINKNHSGEKPLKLSRFYQNGRWVELYSVVTTDNKAAFTKESSVETNHELIDSDLSNGSIENEIPASDENFDDEAEDPLYVSNLDSPECTNENSAILSIKQEIDSSGEENIVVSPETLLSFDCHLCHKSFGSDEALSRHVDNFHLSKSKFSCSTCGFQCRFKKELQRHQYSHAEENHFICEVCGARLRYQDGLKRHMKIHSTEFEFICSCGKGFHRKDKYQRHQKSHEVKSSGSSAAIVVDESGSIQYANKKKRATQKSQEENACFVCGAKLSSYSNLKQHLVTHSDDHPFQCTICDRKFKLQRYLDTHMMYHTGERKFFCEDCGKGFVEKCGYNNHRRLHTGERPHICEFCGLTFAHLSRLKDHRLRHTGERPHVCDICGFGAKTLSKLRVHKRKHTGEKPYNCEYCGKSFAYKQNFDVHVRTLHTGASKFQCDICEKKFERKGKYEEHLTTHDTRPNE